MKPKNSVVNSVTFFCTSFLKAILGDVAKNYPDDGNMSSETKITPNREGPSPLDKINEKYAETVGKVEQQIEKAEEKIEEKLSSPPPS